MAQRCREKQYKPHGGDPYPAEKVPMSQRILLWPFALWLRLTALLPPFLNRMNANLLAWMARSVVRYRRRIVRQNIADCFPDLTEEERRKIEKDFYRNLADYFFQTVTIAFATEKRLKKHITFSGLDGVARTMDSGKDIVLYTSHSGNWEYIPLLALFMPPGHDEAIYAHVNRPLKNLWFNRLFHRLRSRFNTSVPMRQTARAMIGWRREGQRFIIGFLSDQKPGRYTRSTEVNFLGRCTPFIEGTEELARKLHTAVYYTDMRRTGRDRFHVNLVKMCDDASAMPQGALTAEYARLLTDSIRRDPASYLWSHNRWRLPKKITPRP